MIRFLLSLFFSCLLWFAKAQGTDSIMIRKIFETALTRGMAYKNLEVLCRDYGKRLSGSIGAAGAVSYTKKLMDQYGFDSVWLQPCMVPHWVRGEKETAYYKTGNSEHPLTICALGNSVGTGAEGIKASVVEVNNFSQLDSLGKQNISGKIVFYNHPMDQTKISSFDAYGEAVQYRWAGAERAAKLGAVGIVVRSVTMAFDDFPHTGAMHYVDTITKIPACAVSTIGAEELSKQLKSDPATKLYFRQTCEMLKDEPSFNVIGELRGTEYPNQIITVGGHLDAWETGVGAHDDGAGAMQSMEVLYLIKTLNLRPKHTIRAVLFMNEENGGRGGTMYADEAKRKNENHIFAIETDAGGFSPNGFSFEGDSITIAKIKTWKRLFVPYEIYDFEGEGSGADVGHLQGFCKVLSGLSPDSQRYFDYHHAASDTFDKVNRRELELGAAAMTSLIYLMDKYGL
ncbi:MAG: M20/M25/M40 family metallo-hydrolase [Chitinophagales bacterium]|nr:M20/M25/M40 family metallo-hydrolase [Chitinophagales bacterium]